MYNTSYARARGQSDWQKPRGGGLPKPRFWGSREQRMRHVSLVCMHAQVTLLHAWHVQTPKGSSATPNSTYARKRGMLHATMRKNAKNSISERVGVQDTVSEEFQLGEAGKCPPIPAKPSNLNGSKRGPAPRPIHVFSTKRQMPCGVGQMGIARDLRKRPENHRTRPNHLCLAAC